MAIPAGGPTARANHNLPISRLRHGATQLPRAPEHGHVKVIKEIKGFAPPDEFC